MGVEPYPDSALSMGRGRHPSRNRGLFLEEDGTDRGPQRIAIKVISLVKGFFSVCVVVVVAFIQ